MVLIELTLHNINNTSIWTFLNSCLAIVSLVQPAVLWQNIKIVANCAFLSWSEDIFVICLNVLTKIQKKTLIWMDLILQYSSTKCPPWFSDKLIKKILKSKFECIESVKLKII